jgi:CRP-like cAMP-binding protein
MKTLATNIAEHPFLKRMSEESLEIISGCLTERTFESGQIICQEGEPANLFYLVQSGKVALEWREPNSELAHVQTIGAGSVLGWSWLFPPFVWHFKARTLETTKVVVLDGAHLLVMSHRDPRFGYELMKRVAQVLIERLQAAQKKLLQANHLKPLAPVPAPPRSTSATQVSSSASLDARIAQHPFLAGMTPEHLRILTASAMPVEFSAGQVIFHEGDVANRFYLIQSGQVALGSQKEEDDPICLQMIGAGDVLGWSWLFPPYYWHFEARAVEPTKAIFFYGTRLREQCEQDRELGLELMKRVIQVVMKRLQAALERMTGVNDQ